MIVDTGIGATKSEVLDMGGTTATSVTGDGEDSALGGVPVETKRRRTLAEREIEVSGIGTTESETVRPRGGGLDVGGGEAAVPDEDAAVACLAARVRNFYLLHNPEKADGASSVARRYVGLPHTLNERLVTLYGVGLCPSVPDLVGRIEAGKSVPPQTLPRAAGGVELAAARGVQTRNPASRPKEGKGRAT